MKNLKTFKSRHIAACMMVTALGCTGLAIAAEPFVLPAGLACSFELQIDFGGGANRHYREFTDKNGNLVRILDTGTGSALLFTNTDTGETFATKSNGAGLHITLMSDGSSLSTATGHNVIILFPADVPAGPSTTLYAGQVVYSVSAEGVFEVKKESGKKTDICAVLS